MRNFLFCITNFISSTQNLESLFLLKLNRENYTSRVKNCRNFNFFQKKSKKIAIFENTLRTERVNRVRIEIFCIPKMSLRSKATQNNMIWAKQKISYRSLTRSVRMTYIYVINTQIRGLVTFSTLKFFFAKFFILYYKFYIFYAKFGVSFSFKIKSRKLYKPS